MERYRGDYKWRGFSCWDQFLCLAFAQLTYRESLRDIEACLRSVQPKLYHMGFRGRVSRSTLADANETHDWRVYADFAQVLIDIARPLYAQQPLGFELDGTVYALDSTTIDLCLALFPWARFRSRKGAVKMHTLLDVRGSIPTFIEVSDGKTHDVNILDQILPEAGSFYVMDRAYVDFERLHVLQLSRRSLSCARRRACGCAAVTLIRRQREPRCFRIRRSCWPPPRRPNTIRMRCAAFATMMRGRIEGWCS